MQEAQELTPEINNEVKNRVQAQTLTEALDATILASIAQYNAAITDGIHQMFLVEQHLRQRPSGSWQVLLTIDTDAGIQLKECANFNRLLRLNLEENWLPGDNFSLEVGSPGVGTPLILWRQYKKNIGREIEVFYKAAEANFTTVNALTDSTENDTKQPALNNETELDLNKLFAEKTMPTPTVRVLSCNGKLTEVEQDYITIVPIERKKGRKPVFKQPIHIPLEIITSAKILVSLSNDLS